MPLYLFYFSFIFIHPPSLPLLFNRDAPSDQKHISITQSINASVASSLLFITQWMEVNVVCERARSLHAAWCQKNPRPLFSCCAMSAQIIPHLLFSFFFFLFSGACSAKFLLFGFIYFYKKREKFNCELFSCKWM